MDTKTRIKDQLLSIAQSVSGQDKVDAAAMLGSHPVTISRYLRGRVKKEAFGLELLSFLKGRISEREKALA